MRIRTAKALILSERRIRHSSQTASFDAVALVPLAAAAHPEDDRIQHFPPIGDLPPSRFLGPEAQEDRLDPLPQLVGDFPDRTQRFASRLPADHGSVSCRYARKWSLLATSSFLQKVFRRFSDSYLASSGRASRSARPAMISTGTS